MQKFAYQSPDEFRPEHNVNFREAATKPYMGITAFLRNNEPWLVIDFDGKNHILASREGSTVKLNTPFNWIEATDKSRLVAAICKGGSAIPGTPHYSFEEGEWYIRIEDNIYDAEDFLDEIEKTATEYEGPDLYDLQADREAEVSNEDINLFLSQNNLAHTPENIQLAIQEILDPFSDYIKPGEEQGRVSKKKNVNIEKGTCEKCFSNNSKIVGKNYVCQECGKKWPVAEAHDHPEDGHEIVSHKKQEKGDREHEKSDPIKCPKCDSHTTGNRLVDITLSGKGKVHCKSCGHIYTPKGLKLNPKMTYEVDDKGEGNYAPGPDDPNKVCPGCGYSWKENHKWQIGDRSCPDCGHKFERKDKEQDAGAPGDTWKNKKRGTFENETQDVMSDHAEGVSIHDNTPTEYDQATGIKGSETNYAADTTNPVIGPSGETLAVPVDGTANTDPSVIEQYLQQQEMAVAASVKESSWKEDHNYREAEGKERCSNCEYFHSDHCSKFDAKVKADHVCDEWESNAHESSVKIARKAFTPAEQKSLIDEGIGSLARNHSKLNLKGTHYVFKDLDDDPELSLW